MGSVSDGSEESLAASEADSDNGLLRNTAPISPLVGPYRHKYHCQPSILPGHFRHYLSPRSMNHPYAPGNVLGILLTTSNFIAALSFGR